MKNIGVLNMTNPAMTSKLYYIELLKEQFPEKHAELMKDMEVARVEIEVKEIQPKQQETKE